MENSDTYVDINAFKACILETNINLSITIDQVIELAKFTSNLSQQIKVLREMQVCLKDMSEANRNVIIGIDKRITALEEWLSSINPIVNLTNSIDALSEKIRALEENNK